jgi:diguanylate cyclase (GGDEF)-like protein
MTLYRQLAVSIIILFAAGFIGTTMISTSNLRSFLESQLETHAQDTATSLGLSLSPHMRQMDLPVINLMIDAIFDRGYFQSIQLIDIEGDTLVERNRETRKEPVPDWFVKLVSFQTPRVEAIVMSGWKQAGSIYVKSHPGFAYRELWSNARDTFILFLAVAIIILLVALLTLKFLLNPLHEVEKQAEAICERSWLLQSKLPRTRELRSVVVAMNKLTSHVREIFSEQAEVTENLRKQLYLDTVTGLANRQSFNLLSHTLIEHSETVTQGALFLVKLDVLARINDSAGYSEGDRLLREAARLISNHPIGNVPGSVARLSGGIFGLILAGVDALDAESLARDLCEDFKLLQADFAPGSGNFAHIGYTVWEQGRELAELLAESDHALRTASEGTAIGWHCYQMDIHGEASAYGKEHLRSLVKAAVDSESIKLFAQTVQSSNGNSENPLHREILLRFQDVHGKYMAAGIYHPLIDSMDCAGRLDRLVIGKLLDHMRQDESQTPYAINLTSISIRDPDFSNWLINTLETSGLVANRIQLEMMENTVLNNFDQASDLINRLAGAGFQLGIDHFGKDFHPFGYLSTLRVSYIKIDGYYTRGISDNTDNQFFIKSLKEAVHTLGVNIVAQSIETSDEYETLKSIRLDGYQGYIFGRPVPL